MRAHPDPIVEKILNTELTPENLVPALSDPSFISNPKVQALSKIFIADAGFGSFEEADKFAQEVYLVPCHVDLQIIFLATWYGIQQHFGFSATDRMRALESSLNALITEETLAEIKSIVRCVHGHKNTYFWNFRQASAFFEGLSSEVPRESPYFKKFVTYEAWYFLFLGMGTKVRGLINDVEPTPFDKLGIILSKFADCVITGKLEETPGLIQQIASSPNHKYRKILAQLLEMCCTFASLMCESRGIAIPSSLISDQANQTQDWVRSTKALLAKEPVEALHWARSMTDKAEVHYGGVLEFFIHTLIRAELANKNGNVAKRLLLHLHDQGTQTYMDDFYFARAERLLGNNLEAAKHIKKLQSSINFYEAHQRLEFEIQIASELSSADLQDLMQQSIDLGSSALLIPKLETPSLKGLVSIVSASTVMAEVKESIVTFANLDLPVLITGETGTGKELIARALHDISSRAKKRFIAINCGAIPDALIESEFFGHSTGSFTGARTTYKGIFREAEDGTVFLDEVAEISPQLQVALLRVLESGEVRPVGSTTQYFIKCRIIVATNKSLRVAVDQGEFRSDLFYRLQRLEINLPSLRDRPQDIPVIARHFFNLERRVGEEVILTQNLLNKLCQYSWPGNVRELRNLVQRMRILSSDKLLYDVEDLDRCGCELVERESNSPEKNGKESEVSLSQGKTSFRRKRKLRELFDQHGELRVSHVASILGVTPITASRYIGELCKEGLVKKVTPNASPRSHYYIKVKHNG